MSDYSRVFTTDTDKGSSSVPGISKNGLFWVHPEYADDLINYVNGQRERIQEEQNISIDTIEEQLNKAEKVNELMTYYVDVLKSRGISEFAPVMKDDWSGICKEVYDRVQQNSDWPQLPQFDHDMVTRLYYVFNCISLQYHGVTVPKIRETIQRYFERQDEEGNKPGDVEVFCQNPEAHLPCGRRSRLMMFNCLKCFCGVYAIVWIALVLFSCNPTSWRASLNQQKGYISDKMSRVALTPTPTRTMKLVQNKIHYGDELALPWSSCEGDAYWNEAGKVDMSQSAEKELLEASFELYNLCLEAVDQIVKDDALLQLFTINEALWPAIRKSWANSNQDFMGRFDLAWDGKTTPKLIEFNADTPSLQLESSILQDEWASNKYPNEKSRTLHQANYMEQAFRTAFTNMLKDCNSAGVDSIGIPQVTMDEENFAVMDYFNKMLNSLTGSTLSGQTFLHDISDLKIKYREVSAGQFQPIWSFKNYYGEKTYECLFNNYPKEWMANEVPQDQLSQHDFADLKSFEPFWKLILGNKALLPFLWQMRPGHPNLLPSFYDDPKAQLGEVNFNKLGVKEWVSKPLFGREGMGVFFSKWFPTYEEFVRKTKDNYGYEDGFQSQKPLGISIYQAEAPLPVAQGRIIQTGSWIVNGMPAGIIFREGKAGTHFTDYEPFLLHTVQGGSMSGSLDFKINSKQAQIRKNIYNQVAGSNIYTKYGGSYKLTQTENLATLQGAGVSVPYQEWNSYKAIKANLHRRFAEFNLNDADLNIIRGKYYKRDRVYMDSSASSTVHAYFQRYPFNFYGRAYKFGYFAKIDNNGEGQWFSSDRNGIVRVHHYHSGGFGYRIGG